MAFRSYTFSSKLRSEAVMSSSSTPYRFWDGNRPRKTAAEFKTAPEKFFEHPAILRRMAAPLGQHRIYQKIADPLETEMSFASFLPAATRGPGASCGARLRRAPSVSDA